MIASWFASLRSRLRRRARPELEVVEDGRVVALLTKVDGEMFWTQLRITATDPRDLRPYRWDFWTPRTVIRWRATGAPFGFKILKARGRYLYVR